MRAKTILGCLLCTLAPTLWGAVPVQAARAPLSGKALPTKEEEPNKFPKLEGQIEGACGLAVAPGGTVYVSDYHHRFVYTFGPESEIAVPAPPPEGPCGLALHSGGALYVNIWHQRVIRLIPSVQIFDSEESTGVAVDDAGNVYVNDRTYVAVYEPSGAPVLDEGQPLRIGLGSLGDGFGLAVFDGRVYVPDAADNTVKVYEPATDPLDPVLTIGSTAPGGKFVSLVDGAVAVDPTNEHLLVVDNLQPGYKRPEAAIYEFDSSGAFLGPLPKAPVPREEGEPGPPVVRRPVHGEPSGIAVDPATGNVYVTDGNSERSNAFLYGPYTSGSEPEPVAPPGDESFPQGSAAPQGTAAVAPAIAISGESSTPSTQRPGKRSRKPARRGRGRIGVWGATPVRGQASPR